MHLDDTSPSDRCANIALLALLPAVLRAMPPRTATKCPQVADNPRTSRFVKFMPGMSFLTKPGPKGVWDGSGNGDGSGDAVQIVGTGNSNSSGDSSSNSSTNAGT